MDTSWFKTWFNSAYYHLLYFRRNEKEAADFIDALVNYLQPPASATMLDMGCGRGRHARRLADKGFDVTGLDLSPNAIETAKGFEHERLHFFEHDMRLPYCINYFDYCFNFFTSFGYFRTQRENDNALRTMVQSLKPSGVLIIDYLNTPYAEANFKEKSDVEIEDVHFNISKRMDDQYFYKQIEITDNNQTTPLVFTEEIHKYSVENFTEMLGKQQMHVKEIFGSSDLQPYEKATSQRLIIIAEKKN
jgi:SAM-dependent methyltransferase